MDADSAVRRHGNCAVLFSTAQENSSAQIPKLQEQLSSAHLISKHRSTPAQLSFNFAEHSTAPAQLTCVAFNTGVLICADMYSEHSCASEIPFTVGPVQNIQRFVMSLEIALSPLQSIQRFTMSLEIAMSPLQGLQ